LRFAATAVMLGLFLVSGLTAQESTARLLGTVTDPTGAVIPGAITESKRVDFRAQVYNLTNTPSFSNPGGSSNLATGGLVTSMRNQPRLFEFGLKFSF
jgi:hypothetical protein